MKLRPNQLKEHFKKGDLLPLYIVSGDEALLMQETCAHIRSHCRQQGFSERELFNVEPGFDWNNLLQAGNSMSLFGDKKILEVRHDKPKIDDKGKKALQQYCADLNPDNVMLLILPKQDKKSLSAKWFQTVESVSALIQVWPIDVNQLPQWLHQRMHNAGLEPSREAVELLSEKVEGNLLAAAQEVEKLLLVKGKGPLGVADIEESVADHARYNLYELVDEALKGNQAHAVKMLNQLQASGTEPAALSWAFSKEIRALAGMSSLIENGMSASKVMQDYRVWSTRKQVIQSALQRLQSKTFKHCLLEIARIDRAIKGMAQGNPWVGFTNVILWLSGKVRPGSMALD